MYPIFSLPVRTSFSCKNQNQVFHDKWCPYELNEHYFWNSGIAQNFEIRWHTEPSKNINRYRHYIRQFIFIYYITKVAAVYRACISFSGAWSCHVYADPSLWFTLNALLEKYASLWFHTIVPAPASHSQYCNDFSSLAARVSTFSVLPVTTVIAILCSKHLSLETFVK